MLWRRYNDWDLSCTILAQPGHMDGDAFDGCAAAAGPRERCNRVSNCQTCSITLEPVATIGSPSDSVLLDAGGAPVRDSQGRYVATGINGERILMYDQAGRLLKAFGRVGKGAPGPTAP